MDWEIKKIVTLCLVVSASLHCLELDLPFLGCVYIQLPFPPITHACQDQANTTANYDY